MSKAKQSQHLTVEEYLEGENFSDIKHEYIDGQVYAMVGATSAHNIISGNIFGEIRSHLKGKPCQPFMSDMKVKQDSKFFYPDVLVDCSEEMNNKSLFSEKPSLIIEVLSDSTRKFDETTKLHAYKNIESVQEYVLVEQDFMKIRVHRRSDNWHSQDYFSGEEVRFESIDFTLPVEEIYDSIEFE
jgi:Uma2 family endonuclease